MLQFPFYCERNEIPVQPSRRKFTKEEDENLLYIVNTSGSSNWNKIAESMPGRTAKQCRDRYCNYLSQPHSSKPWGINEEYILLSLFSVVGPKWVAISKHIPGRSGNDVKNHWHKHLRNKTFILDNFPRNMNVVQDEEETFSGESEQDTICIKNDFTDIQKQYSISALLI